MLGKRRFDRHFVKICTLTPFSHFHAAACNYSESQFNRVFRQLMGRSPRRYVLMHRLETAKDLLAHTDLPLSEIAGRAGFYDASDFGKRFREQEGLTPRGYRLKQRELIRVEG